MASTETKAQVDNKEVKHDLNNLAYLLKTLSNILAKVPNLPLHAEKLLNGAIKSTEDIVKKLNGSTVTSKMASDTTKHEKNEKDI